MAIRSIHLAATASLLLAGAAVLPAHAQVQVITPTPVQSSEVVIAPNAPPPPRMETIPAPPEQTMYWRPGHWMWSGANWAWESGEVRPASAANRGLGAWPLVRASG